jgi:NCAIR mutase (PurE)-related protein
LHSTLGSCAHGVGVVRIEEAAVLLAAHVVATIVANVEESVSIDEGEKCSEAKIHGKS